MNLTVPPTSAIAFDTFVPLAASPVQCPDESWRPWIIRLSKEDVGPFHDYCRERHITLIDTIDRQLMDLATVRLPFAGITSPPTLTVGLPPLSDW